MKILVYASLTIALAACNGSGDGGSGQGAAPNDALLQAAVRAKLATVDVDSATAVNVEVSKGVVLLSGDAHSQLERLEYSHAARSVAGVRDVDDKLVVNPRMQGLRQQSSDATLAARVSTAIAAQAGINVFHIRTSAHDGIVTLQGTVPSSSIEQTIADTARGVSGVKRVDNRIVVAR